MSFQTRLLSTLQRSFTLNLDYLFCSRRTRDGFRATFLFPFQFFFSPCSDLFFFCRKHGNRANPPFVAEKNRRPRGSQCPQKQRFSNARSGVRTLDTLIKRHFIHYASPCSSSHTIQVFFPSCIFRARTVNSRIVSPVNTRNRISRKMRQPRILPPPLMALRNAFTV